MAIRIALMLGHYRSDREWSDQVLERGEALLKRLRIVLGRQGVANYRPLMSEIIADLANDLDTPSALKKLDLYLDRSLKPEFAGNEEMSPGALSRFLDSVLGLAL